MTEEIKRELPYHVRGNIEGRTVGDIGNECHQGQRRIEETGFDDNPHHIL